LEEPDVNTPENSAAFLDADSLAGLANSLMAAFQQSRGRVIAMMQEAKVREDYDERDKERDMEDQLSEEELQSNVADCLVMMLRTHGEKALPYFAKCLYPALKELISMTSSDRKFSIKVMSSMIEWGGYEAAFIVEEVTPWLIKGTNSRDSELVEVSCYGLGTAARAHQARFEPLAMVSTTNVQAGELRIACSKAVMVCVSHAGGARCLRNITQTLGLPLCIRSVGYGTFFPSTSTGGSRL